MSILCHRYKYNYKDITLTSINFAIPLTYLGVKFLNYKSTPAMHLPVNSNAGEVELQADSLFCSRNFSDHDDDGIRSLHFPSS